VGVLLYVINEVALWFDENYVDLLRTLEQSPNDLAEVEDCVCLALENLWAAGPLPFINELLGGLRRGVIPGGAQRPFPPDEEEFYELWHDFPSRMNSSGEITLWIHRGGHALHFGDDGANLVPTLTRTFTAKAVEKAVAPLSHKDLCVISEIRKGCWRDYSFDSSWSGLESERAGRGVPLVQLIAQVA